MFLIRRRTSKFDCATMMYIPSGYAYFSDAGWTSEGEWATLFPSESAARDALPSYHENLGVPVEIVRY